MKPNVVFGLGNAAWPAFLVTDGVCAVRFANQAAVQVFGENVTAGGALLSAIWPPENGESPIQFFTRCEQSTTATAPLKLTTASGTTISYRATVCPFTDDEGQKFFVLQLMTAPANAAVAAVAASALAAGEAKAPAMDASMAHKQKLDCALQLARTVALDFNNALTIILGHTSLVLSRLEMNNPWRNSLMEVEKSAAKAAEIAADLAAFSRQEKEIKVQQAGNVNVLLQRNVEAFQSTPSEKQITWNLELERRLFTAKFDEAKMQQALLKIVENAVEAIGSHGRVILQSKNLELTQPTQDRNVQLAAGAYVCIEITDNGAGIEAEVLPRIFEPFFTTKRDPKHRGLGLALVYGIVTNHGGGVAVSSQPGVGTSVRVYLPADKKFVKDNGIHSNDLTGNETILIVDDEDLLLSMGQAILTHYGYQVLIANSGQKALDILGKPQNHVDLVLTDLVMPGMSGRELVEHVRRLAPDTRILCTSGYVRPGAQGESDTTYLQKPFTTQELLLKVKHALAPGEPAPVDS